MKFPNWLQFETQFTYRYILPDWRKLWFLLNYERRVTEFNSKTGLFPTFRLYEYFNPQLPTLRYILHISNRRRWCVSWFIFENIYKYFISTKLTFFLTYIV